MFELDDSEALRGLVLHLSPSTLAHAGATYFPPGGTRLQGDHYFVCVEQDGNNTYWIPLTSKPGRGRILIPSSTKRGFANWVRGHTYAVTYQCWRASIAAIIATACAADERTTKGHRNRITIDGLRLIETGIHTNL